MAGEHTFYLIGNVEECLSEWNQLHRKSKSCSFCETAAQECDFYLELAFFVRNVPGIFTMSKFEINRFIQKGENLLNQLFYLK